MKRIFLLSTTLLLLVVFAGCGRSVSNSSTTILPPFTMPEATEDHAAYVDLLQPLLSAHLLDKNWSASDITALISASPEEAPTFLAAYANIIEEEPLKELQQQHPEGLPAALVEQTLVEFFAFTPQQIQTLAATAYDQEQALYHIPQSFPAPTLLWAIRAVRELETQIEIDYTLFGQPIANTSPAAYKASTPATLTMQLTPDGFIVFSSVQLGEQQLAG